MNESIFVKHKKVLNDRNEIMMTEWCQQNRSHMGWE